MDFPLVFDLYLYSPSFNFSMTVSVTVFHPNGPELKVKLHVCKLKLKVTKFPYTFTYRYSEETVISSVELSETCSRSAWEGLEGVFSCLWHIDLLLFVNDMSLVTRNPVFGVFDQVWLEPVCSATGLARVIKIKLHLKELETLYYLGSEQQRRWSDFCCSHIA